MEIWSGDIREQMHQLMEPVEDFAGVSGRWRLERVSQRLIGTVCFESGVIGHRLVVPESPEYPREKQGLSGRSGHVLGNTVVWKSVEVQLW